MYLSIEYFPLQSIFGISDMDISICKRNVGMLCVQQRQRRKEIITKQEAVININPECFRRNRIHFGYINLNKAHEWERKEGRISACLPIAVLVSCDWMYNRPGSVWWKSSLRVWEEQHDEWSEWVWKCSTYAFAIASYEGVQQLKKRFDMKIVGGYDYSYL